MKILIDATPLSSSSTSAHKVRGVGMYIQMLINNLSLYDKNSNYLFAKSVEDLKQSVDILHIPYFEPFFFSLPILIDKKIIVTIHDLIPIVFRKHFPVGIRGTLIWNIQKRIIPYLSAIITDSYASKKDIMRLTGIKDEKVHVVHIAADPIYNEEVTKKQKEEVIKKYNLPDKFLLYVGDVTWNKNVPRLLEAINKQDIPLLIVGKALHNDDFDAKHPWNSDLLRARNIIKESSQITTLGFIPTHELAVLYSLSTAFLMPSLYEGFGLPVLEAMSSGSPVICSKEGSLIEVAGEAAYYIDPYNKDTIVQAIKDISTNTRLRNNLIQKGYKQSQKFSVNKMIHNTIEVYKKINKKR